MDMTVKLQVFEGPLDLLLHLLEKNKVNIYDIPIVEITNQYMEYIAEMKRQDLNVMSEFLVMAATLIDIKSKMLLPAKESEGDEEAEDPRAELVCGCFSAIDELNDECAAAYHVDPSRVYYDAEKMAEAEAGKIDFVSICTPNFVHYSAAKTFLEHGINVVCEKPLTLKIEEAEELERIAKEKNLILISIENLQTELL